jgi:hypothetical protein
MPSKLPEFVMASEKTRNILFDYTESDYQELFKKNFPVSNFEDILDIIKTVQEIRVFKAAFLGKDDADEKMQKMEEIVQSLIKHLCDEIVKKAKIFWPLIDENWDKLSLEQKEVLKIFHSNVKSI